MHSLDFSPEVARVLLANGWNRDRHVDCEPLIQHLAASGYCVHDCAREFLSNIHGLNIRVALPDCDSFLWMNFDVLRDRPSRAWSSIVRGIFQQEICPIGFCLNGDLYLTSDGQVLGDCRLIGHGLLWRSRSLNEELERTFVDDEYREPYELVTLGYEGQPASRQIASWARYDEGSSMDCA
jgi:hypothetical protein